METDFTFKRPYQIFAFLRQLIHILTKHFQIPRLKIPCFYEFLQFWTLWLFVYTSKIRKSFLLNVLQSFNLTL